ncbi:DUF1963 domain-containing protein [Nannocystis punicea]|uniref:DUF1963 domain-containing protein n=1 Tax=Nannocystis punicea TaxID=2995304 RepID=A0ABY7GZK1_9BACT|nr:DUF1963 domain-containing protein [Nannocystis poenicansa]WAS92415.1 DUF1963 domain-containing protein [Nannocystis poenicansa]
MAKKQTESLTLEDVRPRLVRTAFVPALVAVTDEPDYVDDETVLGADDVTASKVGGAPFLSKEAPAPRCGECKQPLRFVLQLRRSDLPQAAQASLSGELLQLFWCDDCQSSGGAENPWSKGALIREVALGEPIEPGEEDEDDEDDEDALSVTFLRDWREVEDYPSTLVESLAAALAVSPKSEATRERLEALAEAMDEAELETLDGVKLAGWPRWVAEPETVKCKCKTPMQPVLQLGESAVVVGDGGTTWIVACPACGKKAYFCQQ